MSGNLLAGVLWRKDNHIVGKTASNTFIMSQLYDVNSPFSVMDRRQSILRLSIMETLKKGNEWMNFQHVIIVAAPVRTEAVLTDAPVCWCAPLWKKWIHAFQILQVKLEQINQDLHQKHQQISRLMCRVSVSFLPCSVFNSSWKSCFVFFFIIDSLAPMSERERALQPFGFEHIKIQSDTQWTAATLTQAEKPMFLFQPFQLLGHKRLHLFYVHPPTLL